jgi:1,4-alpha-glucan branching enzyme
MPTSLDPIHPDTPMGANLIAGGATFRVWAPHARSVHVIGDFNHRARNDASLLNRDDHGHWRGFIPGVPISLRKWILQWRTRSSRRTSRV